MRNAAIMTASAAPKSPARAPERRISRRTPIRTVLIAAVLAGTCMQAYGAATPPGYPSRPVRILVPLTSGGNMDTITRSLALKLSDALGQQVIVDNRPGAGGRVAFEILAGAAPDGHTLMTTSLTSVVHPMLYKSRFEVLRDFTAISQISSQGYVLVVNNAVPARNAPELVHHMKANPGKVSYMSTGIGSPIHLTGELFQSVTGTRMLHVPYKGAAYPDIVSGLVQVGFPAIPTVMPYLQGQRLRPLAVTTPKRLSALPDVPTLAEGGIDGCVVVNWYGIVGPKNIPAALVERISKEIAAAMHTPDVVKRLRGDSTDPIGSTPVEFVAHIRSEAERWGRIIKQADIRGEQ
jgi:tripartite-type tricarboxylate transporter receptor subunit TctC